MKLLKEFVLEMNPTAYDEDTNTTDTTNNSGNTVTVDGTTTSEDGSTVITTVPAE